MVFEISCASMGDPTFVLTGAKLEWFERQDLNPAFPKTRYYVDISDVRQLVELARRSKEFIGGIIIQHRDGDPYPEIVIYDERAMNEFLIIAASFTPDYNLPHPARNGGRAGQTCCR